MLYHAAYAYVLYTIPHVVSSHVAQLASDSPHPTVAIFMDFPYLSSASSEGVRALAASFPLEAPKGGIETHLWGCFTTGGMFEGSCSVRPGRQSLGPVAAVFLSFMKSH